MTLVRPMPSMNRFVVEYSMICSRALNFDLIVVNQSCCAGGGGTGARLVPGTPST